MLAGAHAEENGSHKPSPRACRFLNARIAPFAHCRRFRGYRLSIYRVTSKSLGARGEGFNRRVSISVIRTNAPDLSFLGAPKLTAGADGMESERYDFDKISFEPKAHQPLAEVTFPASIKNTKERDPVQRDFLGKKVTSFVKN